MIANINRYVYVPLCPSTYHRGWRISRSPRKSILAYRSSSMRIGSFCHYPKISRVKKGLTRLPPCLLVFFWAISKVNSICVPPRESNLVCICMLMRHLLYPYCKHGLILLPSIIPQGGSTIVPLLFILTTFTISPLLVHRTLPPCLTNHYIVFVKLFSES